MNLHIFPNKGIKNSRRGFFLCLDHFYRPQLSCFKVMFLHLSVILFTGGCMADTHLDRHPPGRHPLGRHPQQTLPLGRHSSQGRHPLGRHPPPRQSPSPLGQTHTPLGRPPPPPPPPPHETATAEDGTHHTGMHSCCSAHHIKQEIIQLKHYFL